MSQRGGGNGLTLLLVLNLEEGNRIRLDLVLLMGGWEGGECGLTFDYRRSIRAKVVVPPNT